MFGDSLIQEKTGLMLTMTNSCIILAGVTASGEYLGFCAQNEQIMWREIWLSRVDAHSAQPSGSM